jgi:SpoVK/Ycf46/Vps4 family AAA+-type ATPase
VDNSPDLRILFDSPYPLVLAETRDETRLLQMIRAEAEDRGTPVWMWSSSRGLARDGFDPQYGTRDARTAFAFVGDTTGPAVFVFADAHSALTDPTVVRTVKEAAQSAGPGRTIVITAPTHRIPPELEGIAVAWRHEPPDLVELIELVGRTIARLGSRGVPITLTDSDERSLAASLRGTTLAEAERIIQRAVLDDGRLGPDDIDFVRREKFSGLESSGVLELIESQHRTLDAVGGLDGLKEWLRVRGSAVGSVRAEELGLEAPRGVLLTGIPGCGKSFVAKTLAVSWGIPLLLLDPARLYRKFVGESEQRLERALETATAMAPAVLWIDEIEKGFATSADGDGGVSTRILGTFLRWLQDRPSGIFVIATANDVSSLPPEFLRKGRFDEVFFVDLPEAPARRAILAGSLERRGHDATGFDVTKLVECTAGFSGAEIEAVVVGALYRAFGADAPLTTEELVAEADATVPLSVARSEDVAELRRWADGRAVPA